MKKSTELATKYITPKALSIIMTATYLSSLIPLFLIARYTYPSADDFSEGELSHHVWLATHNILAVIWQAVLKVIDSYLNWRGNFSSIFFTALEPGGFGEGWYALTPYMMIGMLSFSVTFLLKAILVKALGIDRDLTRCVTAATLFVMVHCMVGRVEAFYWYSGAVNYIFLHSVGMVMLGAMISAVKAGGKRARNRYLILAGVTAVLAGGGNYMTALDLGIILIASLIILAFLKKWKYYRYLLVPAGLFLAAFAASVLAPGNQVRAAGTAGMGAVRAVLISFHYAFTYAFSEWINWVVFLLILALIPLFWKAAGQTGFSFPYPLPVAVFSFCLLSATMTPPLFAVGNIAAGRLQALTFVTYILLLVINTGYLTGWAAKRLILTLPNGQRHERSKGQRPASQSAVGASLENHKLPNGEEETGRFTPNTLAALFCAAGFLLFGTILCVIPEPHYFTFSSAVTDLVTGDARTYGAAREARAEILNAAKETDDIILEPLPVKPPLLYFGDVTPRRDDWENRAVARFYGVASVSLKEEQGK